MLHEYLTELFDSSFSDKSYAYRPNKGPLKAVNRTFDYIKRGEKYVLKTDIKDFFETIDHSILTCILKEKIKDDSLIDLILMYMKIGTVKNLEYEDHKLGVHQGNIISPILSNIYLDKMDKFLEKHRFNFVRFADDFVVFAKTHDRIELIHRNLKRFLKIYKLSLNEEKTYITTTDSGFAFSGAYFTNRFRTIDKERVKRIQQKLQDYSRLPFDEYVEKMNAYFTALKNYYLRISPGNKFIKSAVIESLTNAMIVSKTKGFVASKSKLREKSKNILFLNMFTNKQGVINLCLKKAHNKLITVDQKIKKKKVETQKKLLASSVIHVNRFGVVLGISRNKLVIKKNRRIIKSFPIKKVERVIFEGRGSLLSSDVIYRCAKEKIFLDFIDKKHFPYASISYYKASTHQNIHKQAMILNTPKQLELAKSFVLGKLKNQKNYLKYLNKYHDTLDIEINGLNQSIKKAEKARDTNSLIGIEGSGSNLYWKAISKVIKRDFSRITKDAKDEVNSALNYGYAILYGKIRQALIYAGLSLHISYLHTLDSTKPTLVFDLIEEFRTYIVDRTIFSMINKNEKIKVDLDGKLTLESKKNISKNIYERLASYVIYRKEQRKLENVIFMQALRLKDAILKDKKYRPFIGRY